MDYKKTCVAILNEEQRYDVREKVYAALRECERARCTPFVQTDEVMMALREHGYVVAVAVEPASPAPAVGDILRDALNEAYELGRTPTAERRFHHGSATTALLTQIDTAGFAITPKPVEGTAAALLTPEGERIVAAISAGDFTGISERQVREFMTLAHLLHKVAKREELEITIQVGEDTLKIRHTAESEAALFKALQPLKPWSKGAV